MDSILQHAATDTLRIRQVSQLHTVQRSRPARSGVTVEPADPATERAAALSINELPNFDHRRMVTNALPECTPCTGSGGCPAEARGTHGATEPARAREGQASAMSVRNPALNRCPSIGRRRAESRLRCSGYTIRTRSVLADATGTVRAVFLWSVQRLCRRCGGLPL